MKRIRLQISGMQCDGCRQKLSAALRAIASAEPMQVTLEPPEAVVHIDPERCSLQELLAVVREAGFDVTSFSQS